MVNFEIDFNPETFALGVAAGWATAYGVYRARHTISDAVGSITQQAESAQNYATRSSDSRYVADLIRDIENGHIGAAVAPLTQILVEPRFLSAPAFAVPPDSDDAIYSVFHVVPQIHDLPYLHAPFNLETMSIADLGNGDRAIALLGLPGSGRTTALGIIALWSLGRVDFAAPPDRVQEQIEAEDANLDTEERAKRIKERMNIEQMAMQTLAKDRGIDLDQATDLRRQQATPVFQRLSPIYVDLANLDHQTGEFSREVDPAEPLVRALQSQVGHLTARNIPVKVYERVSQGQALVLIDGYDDLPEDERPAKLAWLRAFLKEYGDNFIIFTGPATGYGPLVECGLTPVFMRPWMDVDTDTAASKWAEAVHSSGGRRRSSADRVDQKLLAFARSRNRGRAPFEVALKLWSNFEDPERTGFEARIRAAIEHYLPDNDSFGLLLPRLTTAAVLQLDNGHITLDTLTDTIFTSTTGLPAPQTMTDLDPVDDLDAMPGIDDEDIAELFADDTSTGGTTDSEPESSDRKRRGRSSNAETEAEKERARLRKELAKLLNNLLKSGLLRRFRGGRYRFRHSLMGAYLASLSLQDLNSEQILERSQQAAWAQAVAYAAAHTPMDEVIESYLSAPADILHNNVLTVARWLPYAPADAEWRRRVLRVLGNIFVTRDQYPLVRERAAAALVATRDRSSLVVFKRAVNHPDPDVRRLACLGIGAMLAEDGIPDLVSLLNDEVPDVQLAAGLALGAIGTDEAIDEMVGGLTEGSEQLRKAIAEAFAAKPEQGYPILYEAINHEMMELRRAAVFGLARIQTPWALVSLYKTSLEDPQWYVRSAAEQAFHDMQYGDTVSGAQAYPTPDSITWLREWLNQQGEEVVKANPSGVEGLLLALERGQPEVQTLSVKALGQLGMETYIGVIYRALRHRHWAVRDAAYRALGHLQERLDTPLPAPMGENSANGRSA